MTVASLLILFFSAFGGSLLAFNSKVKSLFKLNEWMIFCGAYMLTFTLIHLLPETFFPELIHQHHDHVHHDQSFNYINGVFILIGIALQKGLEHLSGGIEHGHVQHEDHGDHHHHGVQKSIWVILISLMIHSLIEGALLLSHDQGSEHHITAILMGIVLHKFPAAFILGTMLVVSDFSKKVQFFAMVLFAIASPVGVLCSTYLANIGVLTSEISTYVTGVVTGSFMHIAYTILSEAFPQHKYHKKGIVLLILGAGLAILFQMLC